MEYEENAITSNSQFMQQFCSKKKIAAEDETAKNST
jgi:hypothetical protein